MGWDERGCARWCSGPRNRRTTTATSPSPTCRRWRRTGSGSSRCARLPELPEARAARLSAEHALDPRDARLLTAERAVADYYEETVKAGAEGKAAANWIAGELFRLMNAGGISIEEVRVSPAQLAALLRMVQAGQISANAGKRALGAMFESGRPPEEIVAELGLAQVSDSDALVTAVRAVIARYPDEVAKYRAGRASVVDWLMGQVMRETRGRANPAMVRELLLEQLAISN